MQQTAYYVVVIVLGLANVVLAAIAYSQRARQLAGRRLHEAQFGLAEERNRMAAERVERLDQQVELLTAIRDLLPFEPARRRASSDRVVGVIDVGSATVRLIVAAAGGGGDPRKIGDQRSFLHLGAEVERDGQYSRSTLRDVATTVAAFQQHARHLGA